MKHGRSISHDDRATLLRGIHAALFLTDDVVQVLSDLGLTSEMEQLARLGCRAEALIEGVTNIKVLCLTNGADIGPPFTDGRTYRAKHHINALWEVKDDGGNTRYIIPGEKSPHLKRERKRPRHGYPDEMCVGRFEKV